MPMDLPLDRGSDGAPRLRDGQHVRPSIGTPTAPEQAGVLEVVEVTDDAVLAVAEEVSDLGLVQAGLPFGDREDGVLPHGETVLGGGRLLHTPERTAERHEHREEVLALLVHHVTLAEIMSSL